MATQQLELEIINVGAPVRTKTARGGYESLELAFKNLTFEGKVDGKKLVDFNDKAVFDFFKGLKNGDKVTVTREKGENDQYWKWIGAEFSNGSAGVGRTAPQGEQQEPAKETVSANAGAAKATGGRVVGNTYAENNEINREKLAFERVKHRQIARQGCLNTAVDILKTDKGPLVTQDVITVAKELEAFVFDKGEVPF